MPSPFPGMNPYLEQRAIWPDFHGAFLYQLREMITKHVSEKYFVQVASRLVLHEMSAEERGFLGNADVGIGLSRTEQDHDSNVGMIPAPVEVVLPATEQDWVRSLEIRESRDRRLVTVIELLSPSNKTPGDDREVYLNKRRGILRSETHLVEIDLRRIGRKPSPPELPPSDYYILVSQWENRPRAGIWPFNLRDPIPDAQIPLSSPDAPVSVSLQEALNRAYDSGAFEHYLYDAPPEPPLNAENAAWAARLIPAGRGPKPGNG